MILFLRRVHRYLLVVFAALLLSGCNVTPVAYDLTQKQATEIVAVLSAHGIYAEVSRGVGGRALYTVSVKNGYYTQAVSLLHEKGLPRDPEPSFSDLIESKGFLPNSRELDQVRLDRALALEIEKIIGNLPAVKSVSAIARVNYSDDAGPAVSLAIAARADAEIDQARLVDLVVKAVPGLTPEQVGISVQKELPAQELATNAGIFTESGKVITVPLTPFLLSFRVPEGDYNGLALTLLGCILVVAVVGGVFGYWYGFYQHSKNLFEADLADLQAPRLPSQQSNK